MIRPKRNKEKQMKKEKIEQQYASVDSILFFFFML